MNQGKTIAKSERLIRGYDNIFPEYYKMGDSVNTENETPFIKKIEDLQFYPRINQQKATKFNCLQKWEGTVTEIDDSIFLARLQDLTDPGNPKEIGEFLISDILEEDQDLFRIGAIFYWHIGYFETVQGQRIRGHLIRFQRKPMWDKREIDKAILKANKYHIAFGESIE